MMSGSIRGYGHAYNVFVSRKPSGDSLVVGGSAENGGAFARVVTSGAARVLWFRLTQHLFPEHAARVTAMVPTASLRSVFLPAITSHVAVERQLDGEFNVSGWGGQEEWLMLLRPDEARQLWKLLDRLLFPVGW